MYKDVWKRSLAAILTICLVVTLVQWPTQVKAEGAKTWHTYQYGGVGKSSWIDAQTAAAVFTVDQDENAANEVLERISFDVHAEEGISDAKARVSYYIDPLEDKPDTGNFVCSGEVYDLVEGTNNFLLNQGTVEEMEPGTVFSVVVSLEGKGLSFYADEGTDEQKTYIRQEDGAWKDMASEGRYLTLCAAAYEAEPEETNLWDKIENVFTGGNSEKEDTSDNEADSVFTDSTEETDDAEEVFTDEKNENDDAAESDDLEEVFTDSTEETEDTEEVFTEEKNENEDVSESDDTEKVLTEGTEETDDTEEVFTDETNADEDTSESDDAEEVFTDENNADEDTSESDDTEKVLTDSTEAAEDTEEVFTDSNNDTENNALTDGNDPADDTTPEKENSPAFYALDDSPSTRAVTLNPEEMRLGVDEPRQITVSGQNENETYTWESDNKDVATVDNSGKVTAIAPGKATISYKNAAGKVEAECKVTVCLNIKDVQVTIPEVVYTGKAFKENEIKTLIAATEDGKNLDSGNYDVLYPSEGNPSGSTDVEGFAYPQNVGTYEIRLSGKGTYAGQKDVELRITQESLTDKERIEAKYNEDVLSQGTYELKNLIAVTDTARPDDEQVLKFEQDYTLIETIDEKKEIRTVTITGYGNYTDEITLKIPDSIKGAGVEFRGGEYIYNGKPIEPDMQVRVGKFNLIKGTDYTCEYQDEHTSAGEHTVTITGQGDYCGTKEASFTIAPKALNNSDKEAAGEVKVDTDMSLPGNVSIENPPELTVAYLGMPLENGIDYKVSAVTPSEDGTKIKVTITEVEGSNYSGTRTEDFTIGKESITKVDYKIEEIEAQIYTGEECKPNVTVTKTDDSTTLTKGTDYTVSYSNNVKAGQATVTVTGKGNYSGSISEEFTIAKASFGGDVEQTKGIEIKLSGEDDEVTYSPDIDQMKLPVSVTYKEKALEEDKDYTVEYNFGKNGADSNSETKNQCTVTVNAAENSNFTGSATLEYEVKPCSLADPKQIRVTLDQDVFPYTGEEIKPKEIIVKHIASGKDLEVDEDYTVSYKDEKGNENEKANLKNRGTIKVIIRAKGNYTGYTEATYEITGIPVTMLHVEAWTNDDGKHQENYVETYDGNKLGMLWDAQDEESNKLRVKVSAAPDGTDASMLSDPKQIKALQELPEKDYELVYEDYETMSTSKKIARVTVKGSENGNYVGSITYYYLIARNLDKCKLTLPSTKNCFYTGKPIELSNLQVEDVTDKKFLTRSVLLTAGKDFQVEYENNTNASEESVTDLPTVRIRQNGYKTGDWDAVLTENGCYVEGDGNGISKTFTIQRRSLSEVEQEKYPEKYYDNGKEITLTTDDISLTYNGMILTEKDYTITNDYNHNTNISTGSVATVVLNGQGNYNGELKFGFWIKGNSIENVYVEVDEVYYTGSEIRPNIKVYADETKNKILESGKDYTIPSTFYKNNTDASPNGEATASFEIRGAGSYDKNTKKIVFFPIYPRDISKTKTDKPNEDGGELKVEDTNTYTFTGTGIEPKDFSVNFTPSGMTKENSLTDKDYTLDYNNNTNAGENAEIILTGCGNYTGTYVHTFEIAPRSINDPDVKIAELDPEPFNGVKPTPVPKMSYKDYDLKPEDYKLSYKDNDRIGTATVKIEGRGNFTGEESRNFKIANSIESENIEITCDVSQTFTYNGKPHKPKVTVKWKESNIPLRKGIDYEVHYGTLKEDGKNYDETVNTNASLADTTPAKVVVTGIGSYAGSKTFEFRIEPKPLELPDVSFTVGGKADGYTATYTADPITPEIVVTDKELDKQLTEGATKDYTLAYSNNKDAGTATVTVTGQNNYSGVLTSSFTIKSRQLGYKPTGGVSDQFAEGFAMQDIPAQPFNGAEVTPELHITYGRHKLVENTDYTLDYRNNTDITDEAVVIIEGQGNYAGKVEQMFRICKSITGAIVTVNGEEDVPVAEHDSWYKLNDQGNLKPFEFDPTQIKVTLVDGTVLNSDQYEISYKDNDKGLGIATMIISGIGEYAGKIEKTILLKGDLDYVEIMVDEYEYTGKPIEAVPSSVKYVVGDKEIRTLEQGTDYEVVPDGYNDNIEVSDKAELTLRFTALYLDGNKSAYFRIVKQKTPWVVTGVNSSYKYRGEQIKPIPVVSLDGQILKEGTDYTVDYGPNIQVGDGYLKIVGKDEDGKTLTKPMPFKIEPQQLSDLKIVDAVTGAEELAVEYTSKELLPNVKLVYKENEKSYSMLPGEDFTVDFAAEKYSNVGPAEAIIHPSGKNITGDDLTIKFEITPKDIGETLESGPGSVTAELDQISFTYDGTAHEPKVTSVVYQYGEGELDKINLNASTDDGVTGDYTVTYENNTDAGKPGDTNTDAGKADDTDAEEPGDTNTGGVPKVILHGKGNYKGDKVIEFTIEQLNITDNEAVQASFADNTDVYPYMGTGIEVKPQVIVTWNDVPVEPTELTYNVTYDNNKALSNGEAVAQINGQGNFTGTQKLQFSIIPHSLEAEDIVLEEPIPNQAYTGDPIVPEIRLMCGEYQLQLGKDYEFTDWSGDHIEIGDYTVTIAGINGFTGELPDQEIRIRANINQKTTTVEGIEETYPYTGTPVDFSKITVKIGDKTLVPDVDYELSYENGSDGVTARKTHTLRINGIGEYGGYLTREFTITPKNIEDEDVELIGFRDPILYDEKQNIELIWGSLVLQEDTEYTVEIQATGTEDMYMMVVTGVNNFDGTRKKEFKVTRSELEAAEIKGVSAKYVYTGKEINPVPQVWLKGKQLKATEDYTYTYEGDRVNAKTKTAKIIIEGINRYKGTKEKTFEITQKKVTAPGVVCEPIAEQVYTGGDVKPSVKVTDGGNVLSKTDDYTISYRNNQRAGNDAASAIIAGAGNYMSSKTMKFSIKPAPIDTLDVIAEGTSSVTIGWTLKGTATGYEIYRAEGKGDFKRIARRSGGMTFKDTTVSAGKTYRYKVCAYLVQERRDESGEEDTFFGADSKIIEVVKTI